MVSNKLEGVFLVRQSQPLVLDDEFEFVASGGAGDCRETCCYTDCGPNTCQATTKEQK